MQKPDTEHPLFFLALSLMSWLIVGTLNKTIDDLRQLGRAFIALIL